MRKYLLALILMVVTLPQKQVWSMSPTEEEEKKTNLEITPQPQIRTGGLSLLGEEEEDMPTPIIGLQEEAGSYSGPQWGLSEKEIEYLFKNSQDFVCILQFGGHFKRLNSTWHYLLGWEIEELLSTPYINFVHPDDIEKTLEYENKFAPAGLINRYRCKDGSYRWLDWIGLSRTTEKVIKGEKDYPLSIARDITLIKKLEIGLDQRLTQSARKEWYIKQRILEAVTEIQNSHINSFFYENEESNEGYSLQVILQNFIRLSESEFGFIKEITSDQIGSHPSPYLWEGNFSVENSPIRQETTKNLEGFFNNFIEDILSTREPLMVNDIKNYSKKIEIPLELPPLKSFLGIPFLAQGKVIGVIGLCNRVKTINRKLLENLDLVASLSSRIINEKYMRMTQIEGERLQQRQKQAEAENKAKSSFLAHMSHEIRTPLTGLLGMLELINKGILPDEDLNYLQMAHGAGLSLLSILNDILDTSKIEAGQFKLENIKFNPLIIAQEVVQMLSLDAHKKEIDLTLVTNSQLPLYVIGDPTRLRQILFNLIGNAVKFTSKGSVVVSLKGKSDKDHIRLVGDVCQIITGKVTDTGMGISPETQERLFKPFSQSDDSILRRFGGTGLGLFITKKLCEMMGGDITIVSEVDKGTTFRFHIKVGYSKDLISSFGSPTSLREIEKLPNIRVLVAEDNAVNQIILKTLLTKAGCSVTTVWNGAEAVKAITKGHPPYDLVLMDGEMPVMDGIEATQQIRDRLKITAQTLPIIAVTAHAMVEDRERFLQAGMNGYLTKPVQKEGLFEEILRCLSSSSYFERK
ncbi:ATP-binding protein [Candidatus Paracaedibacter symbiosus]|uniref:ATP-binding protein n=1 Tax=Candidatus Paracaedibacter symbiosus TaxID=244582 RepID=UPI00068D498D|nr:ATP-binding protein [Candidatus Paracaedibacter symbiosus]